jgi:hypothetical protein
MQRLNHPPVTSQQADVQRSPTQGNKLLQNTGLKASVMHAGDEKPAPAGGEMLDIDTSLCYTCSNLPVGTALSQSGVSQGLVWMRA